MDRINIKNLEVFGNHGVFPEENKLGQKFLINAVLYTQVREAGLKDDLTKSIHYGEICHYMTKFMQSHTFRLIEAAAENLAESLLLDTPRLQHVDLEILKPWAPIGLPIESVSVEVSRGWHKAVIAFGSNLGEKQSYINEAIEKLKNLRGCCVEQVSSVYVTEPYGGVEQDSFLNGALTLKTLLPPGELLKQMNRIEQEAGRERLIHWGPRTLDLDMIFYDDLVTDDPTLILPHPDMENRAFVLDPVMELCPYFRHPVSKKTIAGLRKDLAERESSGEAGKIQSEDRSEEEQ